MKVAAELRLKHGVLWELCRDMGGTKRLAEAIGIGHQTVHKWLHMRGCPTPGQFTPWYTQEVEERLEALAGVPASEIFPRELKEATKYFAKTSVHVSVNELPASSLLELSESVQQRLTAPDPMDSAIASELRDKLEEVKQTLTERERFVLDCRYKRDLTLADTGALVGRSVERVRAIEQKAIRKMQQPRNSMHLIDFIPDGCGRANFEKMDAEYQEQQRKSLRELVASR